MSRDSEGGRVQVAGKPKLLKTLGIVLLAVAGIALVALLVHLDVQPGHHHLVDIGITNTLRLTIWIFGLSGGGLLGYTAAIRLRSQPGTDGTNRRSKLRIVIGAILLLWSIERAVVGVAPQSSVGQLMYSFSAVVAAVLMACLVSFGSYFLVQGMIRIPRPSKPSE
jgi:hypothetical protein